MSKTMDNPTKLEQLQNRMSKCRQCLHAGYDIFPKAIFSGSPSAGIMIIGQAPGVTEVEAGRPFNAGSGVRLFQWLKAAELDEDSFRSRQYMTSVTKCFPGKDKHGGGDRVPSRAEQMLCRPFLNEEIELINPGLIIPVGRLAIDLFYPKHEPLTKIIGTAKQIEDRTIIPLPHPSGASRWHQIEDNRKKIDLAVELILDYVQSTL